MKKIKNIIFLFISVMFLFSCDKKETMYFETQELEIEIDPTTKNFETSIPLWIPGDYPKIVIVFGHGYEEEDVQKEVLSVLETQFGLADENGLILPLTFPEEYFTNKRVSSDWLIKAIKDENVFAIITVAAPDRTHYSLADLQDNNYPAKVYSVFPQDNILGTESGSEFVLNYKSLGTRIDTSPVYVLDSSKTEPKVSTRNFEEDGVFRGDIAQILIPIIRRINSLNNRAMPETTAGFASFLQDAYSKIFLDSTLTPYVDAQTGIKSQNHYVLGVYDE